jgi:orotidine-5'-phosphate decarboxylase
MKDILLKDRIILALDVESEELARELVLKTESHITFYKVGLQLFMASWFHIVDWLAARGHKVMVDLKFFDIPATVKHAVAQLNNRGITFATIHGNDPIIRAAVEAKGDLALLAVTVLTSFGQEDMHAMGMTRSIEDLVYFRARRAMELGCDGVVSSGLEAKRLRECLGAEMLIVTPGIRTGADKDAQKDDQQRIITAGQAVAAGADYLVVGRPITRAADPVAVISLLQEEIRQGLQGEV